ncbi:MAG: iron chaperone [Clostridia bacterium]|nr:iron chaperone [Clostridia bacterium]
MDKSFIEYIQKIEDIENRAKMEELLAWVSDQFPQLGTKIAWNQPMFTDHGTFIIGFSSYKKHIAVAPEKAAMDIFVDEIEKSGLSRTTQLIQMPWNKPIDYELLKRIIEFNIADKQECATFWRK